MTYAAQMKKMEALRKREERESKRMQKELAKRAKERQKLSELDAARLEVETFENELEVILSIHKESPETFDWAALAFALPPLAPRNPGRHAALHEIGSELGEWLANRTVPDGVSAAQADHQAHEDAMALHRTSLATWQEMRDLGRRVLAGEPSAYAKAISEYSNMAELYSLGSGIHITVHGAKTVEFTVTVKGKDVIPAEVKSLTSTAKLSVKAMPKAVFMAHYQDYVCGCALRVARELFALLPVETLLAHAAVPAFDRSSGLEREMKILSVVLERGRLAVFNFDRLDPSDTLECFTHRGSARLKRGSMEFQEIIPLITSKPGGMESAAQADAGLQFPGSFEQRHRLLQMSWFGGTIGCSVTPKNSRFPINTPPPPTLPLLATVYAALIAFGSLWAVYEEISAWRPLWYIVLDAVSNFGIFALFILYWFPHASRALGLNMPALYVFCLVWVVAWIPQNWKKLTAELPGMEESPLLKRIVITVSIIFSYPAYYFAGLAAFRN